MFKHFGFDLAGAVYISEILSEHTLKNNLTRTENIIKNKATISGVQKKILVAYQDGIYRSTHVNELSTHIFKLESEEFDQII